MKGHGSQSNTRNRSFLRLGQSMDAAFNFVSQKDGMVTSWGMI